MLELTVENLKDILEVTTVETIETAAENARLKRMLKRSLEECHELRLAASVTQQNLSKSQYANVPAASVVSGNSTRDSVSSSDGSDEDLRVQPYCDDSSVSSGSSEDANEKSPTLGHTSSETVSLCLDGHALDHLRAESNRLLFRGFQELTDNTEASIQALGYSTMAKSSSVAAADEQFIEDTEEPKMTFDRSQHEGAAHLAQVFANAVDITTATDTDDRCNLLPEQQVDSLCAKIEELQKELDGQELASSELERVLLEERKEHQEEISSLKKSVESSNVLVDNLALQLEQAREMLADCISDRDELVSKLSTEIGPLRQPDAVPTSSTHTPVEIPDDPSCSLTATMQSLKKHNSQLMKRVEDLEEEMDEKDLHCQRLERRIQADTATFDWNVSKLKQDLGKAKKEQVDVKSLQAELADLSYELQKAYKAKKTSDKKVEDYKLRISQLQTTVEENKRGFEEECQDAYQAKKASDKEMEICQLRINELEATMEEKECEFKRELEKADQAKEASDKEVENCQFLVSEMEAIAEEKRCGFEEELQKANEAKEASCLDVENCERRIGELQAVLEQKEREFEEKLQKACQTGKKSTDEGPENCEVCNCERLQEKEREFEEQKKNLERELAQLTDNGQKFLVEFESVKQSLIVAEETRNVLNDQLASKGASLAEKDAELSRLKEIAATNDEEREKLSNDLEGVKSVMEENQNQWDQQRIVLEKEKDQLEQDKVELIDNFSKNELNLGIAIKDLKDQLKDLQTRYDGRKQEVYRYYGQAMMFEKEIVELKSLNQRLESEKLNLQQQKQNTASVL